MSVKVGIKKDSNLHTHKCQENISPRFPTIPCPNKDIFVVGVLSKILSCDNIIVFIKLSVQTIKSASGLKIKLFVYRCGYVIVTYYIYSLVFNKFKISHHCLCQTNLPNGLYCSGVNNTLQKCTIDLE